MRKIRENGHRFAKRGGSNATYKRDAAYVGPDTFTPKASVDRIEAELDEMGYGDVHTMAQTILYNIGLPDRMREAKQRQMIAALVKEREEHHAKTLQVVHQKAPPPTINLGSLLTKAWATGEARTS